MATDNTQNKQPEKKNKLEAEWVMRAESRDNMRKVVHCPGCP